MGLKKISFSEKRTRWISAIEDQLLSYFDFSACSFIWKEVMKKMYSESMLSSKDFERNVETVYGTTDNKEDFEWKLAKILFLYTMIQMAHIFYQKVNQETIKILLSNIRKNLKNYAPDYTFNFRENAFSTYEPIELKIITDNLNDISNEVANPINGLLKPMKSDTELRGHINEVYAKIEKFDFKTLINLKDIDQKICKKSWEFAKMLVNNVDSAKGHSGDSELSVRDIAHNFALNVSLFWKLVEKNNK